MSGGDAALRDHQGHGPQPDAVPADRADGGARREAHDRAEDQHPVDVGPDRALIRFAIHVRRRGPQDGVDREGRGLHRRGGPHGRRGATLHQLAARAARRVRARPCSSAVRPMKSLECPNGFDFFII